MELATMFIIIGAVAAIIMYPLIRRSEPAPTRAAAPPAAARTRLALTAIKELEFDYETGKIDEDDYRALRARYDAKAIDALERPAALPDAQSHREDLIAKLEAEIRAARGRRFCASCGGVLPKSARFCPACGAGVEVPA
ncbi:MAG TPA: zinc ribbon domain-containing protein [bacterium]